MIDLGDVQVKAGELALARQDADRAEGALRRTICEAIAAGVPVAEISGATGLSRARVYQIRDGRR